MFPDSDIKNLYAHIGGDTEAYREIHRQEQSIKAASRWTLIRRVLRAQVDEFARRSSDLGHLAASAHEPRIGGRRTSGMTLNDAPSSHPGDNKEPQSKTSLKGLFESLVSGNPKPCPTSDNSSNPEANGR